VMASNPWPNFKNHDTRQYPRVRQAFAQDIRHNSGYSYDGSSSSPIPSSGPSPRIRHRGGCSHRRQFHGRPDGLRGPVMFTRSATTQRHPAMIQILGRLVVVWPKESPPRSSFSSPQALTATGQAGATVGWTDARRTGPLSGFLSRRV